MDIDVSVDLDVWPAAERRELSLLLEELLACDCSIRIVELYVPMMIMMTLCVVVLMN